MQLTTMQGYQAMIEFLERLYSNKPSEALLDLLGDIQLNLWGPDISGDPAELPRWENLTGGKMLTPEEAFAAMSRFVNDYFNLSGRIHLSPFFNSNTFSSDYPGWQSAVESVAQAPKR